MCVCVYDLHKVSSLKKRSGSIEDKPILAVFHGLRLCQQDGWDEWGEARLAALLAQQQDDEGLQPTQDARSRSILQTNQRRALPSLLFPRWWFKLPFPDFIPSKITIWFPYPYIACGTPSSGQGKRNSVNDRRDVGNKQLFALACRRVHRSRVRHVSQTFVIFFSFSEL